MLLFFPGTDLQQLSEAEEGGLRFTTNVAKLLRKNIHEEDGIGTYKNFKYSYRL